MSDEPVESLDWKRSTDSADRISGLETTAIDVDIEAEAESKEKEESPEEAARTSLRGDTFEVDGRRPSTSAMGLDNGSHGFLLCCGLVVISIAALLTVILVPLSFSDLEYYEMGFVKKKSTGTVDRSKVYTGGRHFIGVDGTFKKFPADAHLESFSKVEFFNMEKLQVTMTFSLQYFLMPEELKSLHDAYNLGYRPVIRNTVASAIKDEASKFSVNEYRKERQKVSDALFKAAKIAIGGSCCYSNCQKYICLPDCLQSNCTKGLYSYLKYFQMEEVDITDDQQKKFLQTVIEREKRDTEDFKQQEKIERKKTDQKKVKIENDALEVKQNAAAKSSLIKAQADASAKALVENARNSGLQQIFEAVNITAETHKKSLDYIRTMLNHKSANVYVGFTTMVAKEGT
ncbi:uncharacterized protein LOC135681176 [Rhopilema esculentum]|uniref:uncharacterized protein LOC135681176 n=1 Tax=Rhopilema esculentum TaxID=499914 RepID=UPI0031DA6DEB|eukprot:gene13460-4337_t